MIKRCKIYKCLFRIQACGNIACMMKRKRLIFYNYTFLKCWRLPRVLQCHWSHTQGCACTFLAAICMHVLMDLAKNVHADPKLFFSSSQNTIDIGRMHHFCCCVSWRRWISVWQDSQFRLSLVTIHTESMVLISVLSENLLLVSSQFYLINIWRHTLVSVLSCLYKNGLVTQGHLLWQVFPMNCKTSDFSPNFEWLWQVFKIMLHKNCWNTLLCTLVCLNSQQCFCLVPPCPPECRSLAVAQGNQSDFDINKGNRRQQSLYSNIDEGLEEC